MTTAIVGVGYSICGLYIISKIRKGNCPHGYELYLYKSNQGVWVSVI